MVSQNSQLSLRGTLVPSTPSDLTEEEDLIVINAVTGLHELCEEIIAHQDKSGLPLKLNLLDDVWKQGIFSWLTYLFDHYHPLPSSPVPSRWTVISQVSCALAYHMNTNPKYIFFEDDNKCIQLAVRLWLITDYDHTQSEWAQFWGFWKPFLCLTSLSSRSVKIEIVREKILDSGLGLDDNTLCHMILERMQASLMNPKRSPIQHSLLTISLGNFIYMPTPTGPTLNQLVSVMVRTLKLMVDYIIAPIPYAWAHFYPSAQLIHMIRAKLGDGNSVEAVVVAIKCGLFEEFAQFCGTMKRALIVLSNKEMSLSMINGTLKILSEEFPKYMHYESVLKHILLYVMGGTISNIVLHTMAAKEWEKFQQLFNNNWGILIKKIKPFPYISFCDNPSHGVTKEKPDKPRKCTRCMAVWYCSEKCQKEDWITTHRNVCTATRRLNGAMPDNRDNVRELHRSDYQSACQFAILDVRKKWATVKNMAAEKHPGLSMSKLSIVVDYTEYPVKMDITFRDPCTQHNSAAIENATVINCIVPLGEHIASITAIGDLDNIGKKTWLVPMITYDIRPSDDDQSDDTWYTEG